MRSILILSPPMYMGICLLVKSSVIVSISSTPSSVCSAMTIVKIGSSASSKFFFLTDIKCVIECESYSSMSLMSCVRGFSTHTC